MINKIKKHFCVLMSFLITVPCIAFIEPAAEVNASVYNAPFAENNIDGNFFIKNNYFFNTTSGYGRVVRGGDALYAEEYNDSFELQERRTIPIELKDYVGFFCGADNYYFVFYDTNEEQDDSKEVIRVVKYSKDWSRISAAGLTSGHWFEEKIITPFSPPYCAMDEINGKLYLATGHIGYIDPEIGRGHQGLLMFEIDEAEMTGKIITADLYHSMSQHLSIKDEDNIFLLEESEGAECTRISCFSQSDISRSHILDVLQYGGQRTSSTGVATFAFADGITYSDNNVLAVGTSIDQSKYGDPDSIYKYDVYLAVAPINSLHYELQSPDDRADPGKLIWISDAGFSEIIMTSKIVKINNNRFLIMWENANREGIATNDNLFGDHVLHYVFVDGNGNKLSNEMTSNVPITIGEPVLKNGYVSWCASSNNNVEFVSLNAATGEITTKTNYIAGEHATWEIKEGVLYINGTGKIADWFWGGIADDSYFKTVIISEGITEIGENSFNGIKVDTIILPEGLRKIERNAFLSYDLRAIYIPDSVTEINGDPFCTGYYYDDKPVHVITIHCNEGSFASKYASENGLNFTTSNGGYNFASSITSENGEWVNSKWYNAIGTQNYNGIMEWKKDGNSWYIKDSNGYIPKNKWERVDYRWYYFDEDGIMASNEWRDGYWLTRSGGLDDRYFGSWKSNATGKWFEDISGWYPISRWQKIDGEWYYFNSHGYMESDCYRDGYRLNSDGTWNTDYCHGTWKKDSNGWRFTDDDWSPAGQWLWINGYRYYFDDSGYMESSCYRDGCWLTASGAWDPRYSNGCWKSNSIGKWYEDNGWYPVNCSLKIDGVIYNFDARGYLIEPPVEGGRNNASATQTTVPEHSNVPTDTLTETPTPAPSDTPAPTATPTPDSQEENRNKSWSGKPK